MVHLTETKRQKKRLGKILVVDDDKGLIYVLREMLQSEGFQVRTANDGSYGCLSYLIFKPDLILTDIQMPETSGLEMMKRIRMHNPHVRTIYMSGDGVRFRSQLEREVREYGAGIIAKPFSKEELIGLITVQAERKKKDDLHKENRQKSVQLLQQGSRDQTRQGQL